MQSSEARGTPVLNFFLHVLRVSEASPEDSGAIQLKLNGNNNPLCLSINYTFFFFLRQSLTMLPRLECMTSAHYNLRLLNLSDFWLIFVFLVETGTHLFGQAGLKLLTSSDPPASASQSAAITDVSHHAWAFLDFYQRNTVNSLMSVQVRNLPHMS